MEDRGLATFAFTQGAHEVEPPLGWENYFGSRPLYRFVEAEAGAGDAFEVVRRVRHIPRGLSPEATLRLFKPPRPIAYDWRAFREALDRLFEAIEADGEIDGLLGYSEGAMMAASICAEENRRWEEMGVPRRIKVGLFPFLSFPFLSFTLLCSLSSLLFSSLTKSPLTVRHILRRHAPPSRPRRRLRSPPSRRARDVHLDPDVPRVRVQRPAGLLVRRAVQHVRPGHGAAVRPRAGPPRAARRRQRRAAGRRAFRRHHSDQQGEREG